MRQASYDEYYDYMQSVIPRLVEAENTIKEIKGSEKWRRASNYFKVLFQRGYLAENPCSKNGYKIEKSEGAVLLNDIKDILTPEQLEKVKKLAI